MSATPIFDEWFRTWPQGVVAKELGWSATLPRLRFIAPFITLARERPPGLATRRHIQFFLKSRYVSVAKWSAQQELTADVSAIESSAMMCLSLSPNDDPQKPRFASIDWISELNRDSASDQNPQRCLRLTAHLPLEKSRTECS